MIFINLVTKRKLFQIILIVLFFIFAYSLLSQKVLAAEQGDIVNISGVLENNLNTAFTHKIGGYNFILNNSVNQYLNKEVIAKVQYLDSFNFKVISVSSSTTPIQATGSSQTAITTGNFTEIKGVLEKNPNTSFTHKIDGFNFILHSDLNDWVGKEVVITVQYTDGFNFKVISSKLA